MANGECAPAMTYDWDFGDGAADASARRPSHTHASAGARIYALTVAACDWTASPNGAAAGWFTMTVTTFNLELVPRAIPDKNPSLEEAKSQTRRRIEVLRMLPKVVA
jgi:hypothetical protein